jgi:2,3-bisphosphoglycerate-dependent phosphoglycerate mutase
LIGKSLFENQQANPKILLEGERMTNVYFVRHAEPAYSNHDDASRPLTEKGRKDRELVTEYLKDKNIQILFSSPYKRAYDTLLHFSENSGIPIQTAYDFRERCVDSVWVEDFSSFCKKQWQDFTYRYAEGECLKEVQERNIKMLNQILKQYPNHNIAIGSHGTALSTILHYYDNGFGYKEFEEI